MIVQIISGAKDEYSGEYWYEGDGFYFVDDGEQLIGPYPTKSEAWSALNRYCDMLDSVGGGL